MTDAHLDILRAIARGRARRLAADTGAPAPAEGPSTERHSELARRSAAARAQLTRAHARRRSSHDA